MVELILASRRMPAEFVVVTTPEDILSWFEPVMGAMVDGGGASDALLGGSISVISTFIHPHEVSRNNRQKTKYLFRLRAEG